MFLKNQNGIGLIEVMISITVLTIGILGLLSAFPGALSSAKETERQTLAAQFAQSKLEELLLSSYENLPTGAIENNAPVVSDTTSPLYQFTRTTTIELVDQNLDASQSDLGLKKARTTVFWRGLLGTAARSVSLTVLISEK